LELVSARIDNKIAALPPSKTQIEIDTNSMRIRAVEMNVAKFMTLYTGHQSHQGGNHSMAPMGSPAM